MTPHVQRRYTRSLLVVDDNLKKAEHEVRLPWGRSAIATKGAGATQHQLLRRDKLTRRHPKSLEKSSRK